MLNIFRNELLLTPGPTKVPKAVWKFIKNNYTHHRSDEFKEIYKETSCLYKNLVNSENDALFLSGSGTLGMEVSVSNFFNKNDRVLIISMGKFGERFKAICDNFQLDATMITFDPIEKFNFEKFKDTYQSEKFKGIFFQICETSTASYLPYEKICTYVKNINKNCLTILDGITAVGAIKINQTKSQIDILITGSQKALMLPPGLVILTLSNIALNKVQNPKNCFYSNLNFDLKALKNSTSSWTSNITIILGLYYILKNIKINLVYDNMKLISENLKFLVNKFNCQLYSKNPSPTVTAIKLPETVKATNLIKDLNTRFKIRVVKVQGDKKDCLIRVSHMGALTNSNFLYFANAFFVLLNEYNVKIPKENLNQVKRKFNENKISRVI